MPIKSEKKYNNSIDTHDIVKYHTNKLISSKNK